MVQGSRESIVNAVFRIASKHPEKRELTMAEIAKEAGMSRQAIYQKHFNNVDDIYAYIHELMTEKVFETFKTSIVDPKNPTIYEAVANDIIPLLYQNRLRVRTIHAASLDWGLSGFLEDHYLQLIKESKITIINQSAFSTEGLIKITLHYISSILGEWLTEDFPEPPPSLL